MFIVRNANIVLVFIKVPTLVALGGLRVFRKAFIDPARMELAGNTPCSGSFA